MKGRISLGKKGVTPVIAIIMLLLIVVVMVGGVFSWMQTMQDDVQRATQEQLSSFMEEVKEDIRIENYKCDSSTPPNVTDIYVRNNDDVDSYKVSVYHNGGLAIEEIELETDTLHELVQGDKLSTTLNDEGVYVKRGDTVSLGSAGEIIQSETFSC